MRVSIDGRAYEWLKRELEIPPGETGGINTWKLLFAGGLAGTLSWASIYPLGNAKERQVGNVRMEEIDILTLYTFLA